MASPRGATAARAALAAAARHGGVILPILVDYDVGQNRTGAPTPDAALKVAQSILDQPNLKLAGLQAYAGHIQHIVDRNERQRAAGTVHARVHALLDLAAERGIDFPTISGGGTGTHAFDAQSSVFTELQPGSYVFMDAEYQTVLSNGGVASPFETSLFVQTTVVSAHHLRRATMGCQARNNMATRVLYTSSFPCRPVLRQFQRTSPIEVSSPVHKYSRDSSNWVSCIQVCTYTGVFRRKS